MKNEKLFYQFYKAIERCTALGADKHSYKKTGCKKVKIFSYEDRRNIIKVTTLFCDYIEEFYPNIKYIRNINKEHVQEFFIEKSNYCTKNTLKNYNYCIRKLEKMVKQELKIYIDYTSNVTIPNGKYINTREIDMTDEDIKVLLEECNKSNSKAVIGIKLAINFGLRVSEVCKMKGRDIRLDKEIIHVHESKGKRSRDIKIESAAQKELCEYIKAKVLDDERVCKVREDTVNVTIQRMLIKNKIDRYKESKTAVHAIRKTYAKNDFHQNLEKHNDEIKAWNETSAKLGHNSGRKTLKNVYVKE